ncbi:MAG: hypothetical protein LBR73_04465 [Oscillospiraceae bacterium]|jgi:galactose mutarotase-like enzyme|nr:hypothetical protein [Oscillospiraceae bacterium]
MGKGGIVTRYVIQSEELAAAADTHGAELQSVSYRGEEYLWQGDANYWAAKSPLLFPICGRLKGGQYKHGGNTYKLGCHGFAQHTDFLPKRTYRDELLFRDSGPHPQYPFPYRLEVGYGVKNGNTLTATATVTNPVWDALPCSLGFHPGFWYKEGDFLRFDTLENAHALRINKDGLMEGGSDPEVFLNGTDVLLTPEYFMTNHILEGIQSEAVTLMRGETAVWRFAFRSPFRVLGIWSVPNAPFVCIEPWIGLPDPASGVSGFYAKPGLVHLAERQTLTLKWELTVYRRL